MAPRVDSNIHWLIHYPLASAIDFGNTYAMGPTIEQWEPFLYQNIFLIYFYYRFNLT